MTTWSEVLISGGPWVHRADAAELPLIREAAGTTDVLLVELDGARMSTVDELFREYVREFSFPEYFGWNWDAFDECMHDLEERPARAYLTIVIHADHVLSAEREDLATYLRQLEDIGHGWSSAFGLRPEWGGGEVPFHTVLIDPDY